jgi:hypothetical protein
MTFQEFETSLAQPQPPAGLSDALQAMWHDGKGDWHAAHELAQVNNSATNCWIHAYLHRKEGDNWNAQYWYTRAGKPMPKISLDEEWQAIVKALL